MAENGSEKTREALQSFVDMRNRPAVFMFLVESMDLSHAIMLRTALAGKNYEELDLVINSGGGSIHAAYQIVELLRMHTKQLNACVPFYAKSAATLLCIGADKIVLDELAQLGPLDTQIYEERRGGKGEYTSALNPFKTLEQLQDFSLETLDLAMSLMVSRSRLDLDECFKHAMEFVRVTTGPLFTQLNPEKLGAYSRQLSVGEEYGKRLLRRFNNWDEDKRDAVIQKLVHGYPSHDYIIDYHELQEMGFEVELFREEEHEVVEGLFGTMIRDESTIECIEPSERVGGEIREVG